MQINHVDFTQRLLTGAVAYHTHFGWVRGALDEPCAPILDAESAVSSAAEAGLRAIVLRDLYCNSAGTAAILQPAHPEIAIFGGMFLNAEVGGLNPIAVDTALSYGSGARFVCLPTDSSAHLARFNGIDDDRIRSGTRAYVEAFPEGEPASELLDILELVAAKDIILETGYLAPRDVLHLVRLATDVGVNKIVVTHPSPPFIGMTIDEQLAAAELGAYIEYTWMFYTHHFDFRAQRYGVRKLAALSLGDVIKEIRAVGPERSILSTDFGQLHQGSPEEGLRQFVYCLAALGVPEGDLKKMIEENPMRLLDL